MKVGALCCIEIDPRSAAYSPSNRMICEIRDRDGVKISSEGVAGVKINGKNLRSIETDSDKYMLEVVVKLKLLTVPGHIMGCKLLTPAPGHIMSCKHSGSKNKWILCNIEAPLSK